MTNVLDDIPQGEPTQLVAGNSWSWSRADLAIDYPSTEWALTYRAMLHGQQGVRFSVSASGAEHTVTVAAATTAAYEAGRYSWDLYAVRGSDRLRIASGHWIVAADFATSKADPRGHAERMLAMVEAVLEGRASKDVESYRIGDRELKRMPLSDLLALRDRYKSEVFAARAAANGRSPRRRSLVLFR